MTPGCYEYQDLGDFCRTYEVQQKKTLTRGQEWVAQDQEEQAFLDEWGTLSIKDAQDMALEKGKGKGKDGKGKSLGKGKGKGLLAIKDKDQENDEEQDAGEPEAEQWEEAVRKARRARDLAANTASNMEEAKAKVDKKHLSAALKKEGVSLQEALQLQVKKVKQLILKKHSEHNLEVIRGTLTEKANKIKDAKEHIKQLNQLANKTQSKATSKK